MSDITEALQVEQTEMVGYYEHLHRHPELGFHEFQTAAYIADLLKGWGYDVVCGVGGTGVVATLENHPGDVAGANDAHADNAAWSADTASAGGESYPVGGVSTASAGGRKIALRAEMDALPMQEGNGAKAAMQADGSARVCSEVPGVAHMCGHDGHCAMLLGAAKYLAKTKNFNGTLRLIFQPAEETMGGSIAMMDDGLLERFPIDAIFGMHNSPGLDVGKIYLHDGPVLTAADKWEIELEGKGVHGSMPDKGIDPIVAGSALVMALQTIVSRNVSPTETAVVTVGSFQSGTTDNIIPQTALLKLCVRSASPETRQIVLNRIREITVGVASAYGVTCDIREGRAGAVLVNDAELGAQCRAAALQALGADGVELNGEAEMASEDFAYYTQRIPGFYVMIGIGDTPMNHHPDYHFNTNALVSGAAYWAAITEALLK